MERTKSRLKSLRVRELVEICKQLGLKHSGRKAEIIDRIARAEGDNLSRKRPIDAIDCSFDSMQLHKKTKPDHSAARKAADHLFSQYEDPDSPDEITDEGILSLCSDLQVDAQDPVMLALAYTMEAKEMCIFTRQDFYTAFQKLNCNSLQDLKTHIKAFRDRLANDKPFFTAVYAYSYNFAREGVQKSITVETALALWEILLNKKFALLFEWLDFVKKNHKKVVSKDLWMQTLEFANQISPNLSNYDEDSAWPVLLDDFVSHLKSVNSSQTQMNIDS